MNESVSFFVLGVSECWSGTYIVLLAVLRISLDNVRIHSLTFGPELLSVGVQVCHHPPHHPLPVGNMVV